MLIYYLLIAVTTIPYHWLFASSFLGLTITKWIGILSLFWAVFYLPMRRPAGSLPRGPVFAFLAYFGVQLASCMFRGPGISMQADFMKLIAILSLFLVVVIMTDTEERFLRVLLVLVVAVAFSSNYVIRQFFEYYKVYRGWRTGGAAGDANYYAAMVVIWLPACLVLLATAKMARDRLIYLGCTLVMLIGFVLASSRGGMVALAAGFVFMVWRSRYRAPLLFVGILLFLPLTFLLPASPAARFLNPTYSDISSSAHRLTLWTAAAKLWADHPLVGVGTVGFKRRLQEYQDPDRVLEFTAVHNTYLECGAIWGIVGLAPFLLTGVLLFRRLGEVGRQTPATPVSKFAVPFQAGLIGYAVAAVFVSTWWFMMYWLLVFLSFAMIRLAGSPHVAAWVPPVLPPPSRWARLMARSERPKHYAASRKSTP